MTDEGNRPPKPTTPFADWPRPLAFVLSGGGAFGSVQVGMLQALRDHGLFPDLVVGSSVGSLNGAVIAHDPVAAPDVLADVWERMDRSTLFGHGWIGIVRNLVTTRSLSRFDLLSALIDDMLPIDDFDGFAVPFAAVATDAINGEPELLRSGRIKPALLASSAVPGLFPPVGLDDRLYIDGGVSANIPIRQAIAFGARSVIALDASPRPSTDVPTRTFSRAFHVATLMVRNQRAHAIDDLVGRYPILVLPSVTPPDMGSFNFDHTRELIDGARSKAADLLGSSPSVVLR